MILILLIEAFVAVFHFPTEQLYTMSAVVLAVVGLRVLYQVSQPLDWKRSVLIAVMALAELVCFTVLSPVFGFTAPTLETGLVLVVFMMLSFQIMRTVLMIFEKTGLLVGKLKEKRQDRLSLGQNLRRR